MNIIPVKTKILEPPKDDLCEAVRTSALKLVENDLVVISSKAVSIDEGNCLKQKEVNKDTLVRDEAEAFLSSTDSPWTISVKHGTFISGAGIDKSNAGEYFALLPKDPCASADRLRDFLQNEYGVKNLGIVISDSHSVPLRHGSTGVAIGWSGFEPVTSFKGKPDLFGRAARHTHVNIADALAAAGVLTMGELSEQTPLAVIRDVNSVNFTDRDTSGELLTNPREDKFWPILKELYEEGSE